MSLPSQVTITGPTRLLAILGDPVDQVKSPQSFNPRLAAGGRDAVLIPLHLRSDDFEQAIASVMRIANLDGLVVTMPFKDRIIPFLGSIGRRASLVGSVNAARRTPSGEWEGDIFDGVGLLGVVRGLELEPKGLRVGLLGAGGAGSAIAFALAESGVASLDILDRDPGRAKRLASRVAASGALVEPKARAFAAGEVDLLVNATPVGMQPGDRAPIDLSTLGAGTSVIDIVTRPGTALLAEAAKVGCRHAGGAAMVAAQTAAILEFLGFGAPDAS